MNFKFLFRTFNLGLATATLSLAAATDPAPIQLDRLDVTASRPAPLTVPALDAASAELRFTPGGVETIAADRFLRGRASTVDDTFALSPGVIALSRFGSDEARLSIRGSGLQRTFHGRGLRILQDGVPLNLADGSFDMQALDPLSAAYINVWRGGNALAAGASTLGGAIDYVSRTGRETIPFLARVEAGSWAYLKASLAGGAARGDLDAYASFTHQSQTGFRAHAAQSNQRLFANTGWRISADAETRFYITTVRTDSELPGNLTKAQLAADPTQAAAGNLALDQHRNFDLFRVASKTTLTTGSTAWDFTAAWNYKDLDHPIFQVIDQRSNDLLLGTIATHNSDFADRANRLRAGLLYQRGVLHAANFVNVAGKRGALVASAIQTAANLEAFAEDQLALGRGFTIILGASASVNERENDQTLGATPDYDLNYHRVMPKLGLRWDGRDVQVFANVSGSYEPPSFSETLTLNTARAAQTATTWEIGTRGFRGPFRWDATLYRAALRHELLTLDDDNNPATPAATVNANATTHAGIEFATEIDLLGGDWSPSTTPAHRLVLRSAWTYGRFRFDADPRYGNNVLAGLPPHLINGELTWEAASGWYAGPTWQWAPQKTSIDFRNTYAADAYAIAGFRFGRRRTEGFSWFVEIRNVFAKNYTTTTGVIENAAGTDQAQFLPGDGRGCYVGMEHRW
ncbi:MAG: TonB-dependent receptor [Opitutaceae bacterium]|jgi:iron complex outermembrane receptor protein|nr:TonB-dependent receptor [Opitutaceae bacterium]MBP9911854.1 TonB-dependent receptor [Opitutaceae bacterium]